VNDRTAAILAVLSLLGAPGCPPASNADRVARCTLLYQACVDNSSSQVAYLECRDTVDEQCLDTVDEERP